MFKIVSTAAALHYGFAEPEAPLPCPASYEWNESVYDNWRSTDSGHLTLAHALEQSCDTVFYFLARQIFTREQRETPEDSPARGLHRVPRGRQRAPSTSTTPLGIDLPGEIGGVIPGRQWRQRLLAERPRDLLHERPDRGPGQLLGGPVRRPVPLRRPLARW